MKKLLAVLLTTVMFTSVFTACGQEEVKESTSVETTEEIVGTTERIEIDKLVVGFIPSRDPDEIVTATEPLKEMLTEELSLAGYDVKEVEITVGTTYEVVAEGLAAGTIDIGLIPGSTYVLYDDGAEVILTATRDGLSIDSDDAIDWNENKPTEASEDMAVSYRALIIAGPSEKGQAVAAKVNAGEALTWEDVNDLTWNVMSTTSPAGYVYPSLWLQENFENGIIDLENAVIADSYGSAFARLAAGQTDVLVTYADARRDNEEKWTSEFGREASIWDETNVIGVTPGIYNDTVCVSKSAEKMDDALKAAISDAFINIGNTDEGKEVIAIYQHMGYQVATSEDYDSERAAQQLLRELSSAN
ncbi:MAG: phosphate/phosphite/phosphonate ABC transporter substrate-binding protein [Lachnospiraceae bacterium]